ncbi:MAG: FIST C-terminal domain-containing protein [Oscillospiraceae bacterium]|jgi:hypothetical protein|nr:FIST C-terminal domain-containing protein [Oscillospiraceae bacterium]
MIKSHVITVSEIDEPSDAVAEIREKMKEVELLKNTVGIVSVHAEYFRSGVYAAVASELPFPLAGISTVALSANGEAGMFMFSILILTSDDCRFLCGHSDTLSEEGDSVPIVKKCYNDLKEKLGEKPKLAIMYAPVMMSHIPGEYIDTVAGIDPSVPVFGAVANSSGQTIEEIKEDCRVLCGNEILYPAIAFVLVAGDFSPEFFIGSLTQEAVVMPNVGEITKAEKNKLIEINNVSAPEFFKKVGFELSETSNAGILTSTLMLDFNNKSVYGRGTISRAPLLIMNDMVICAGNLYEGAVLSVAFSTTENVVRTARDVVEKIKEKGNARTVLIYSCIGRRIGLMSEPMKEMETIEEIMPKETNHTMCYVGGELCPIAVTPEKAYNHEHNQTIIACVF